MGDIRLCLWRKMFERSSRLRIPYGKPPPPPPHVYGREYGGLGPPPPPPPPRPLYEREHSGLMQSRSRSYGVEERERGLPEQYTAKSEVIRRRELHTATDDPRPHRYDATSVIARPYSTATTRPRDRSRSLSSLSSGSPVRSRSRSPPGPAPSTLTSVTR
jgi:hypothetical protein